MKKEGKKKRRLKRSIKLKLYQGVILLNILWILLLVCYYSYRLVYFYKEEHKVISETGLLVDNLILEKNITVQDDGLYHEKERYIYKGKVDNNYVFYAGLLWRIMSIDQNHNIKLITDEVVTTLPYGMSGYENSYLHNWLLPKENVKHTGIFLTNLKDYTKYQVKGNTCIDKIDSISNSSCKSVLKEYAGFISLTEYEEAKGKNGYLNNGTSFFTSSTDSENLAWYIKQDGSVAKESSISGNQGVRPTITLSKNVKLRKGEGSRENPYQIEERTTTKLADSYVGEYVIFENQRYRVIENNNQTVKLVLDGTLKNDIPFDSYNVSFDPTNYYNIGYDLNHTILDSYRNANLLQDTTFYNGFYNEDTGYDYLKIYTSQVTAKVGLPQIGDYFITNFDHIYTMNPANSEGGTIVTVENGKLYADLIQNKKDLRPVISLSGGLKVTGSGTFKDAFKVGV